MVSQLSVCIELFLPLVTDVVSHNYVSLLDPFSLLLDPSVLSVSSKVGNYCWIEKEWITGVKDYIM